ncbi:MAG: septal ring lytic transglycosylase RlpA family protein [Magnetococcales bacterium]|nr:septal ring lytic transglycosylase RlpA family protein [Magnetococcales bacterium]
MQKLRFIGVKGWLVLALLLFPVACTRPPEQPPEEPVARIPPPPVVKRGTSRPYEIFGKMYYPMSEEEAVGYVDEGVASWYGKEFHDRPTAIGERYDMYGISAAHTILPLPIMVRVTNLDNGQSLDVRVNDRGPFVNNRLIDLSYGAAEKLGVLRPGTANVRVEALPDGVQVAKAHPLEAYRSRPKPKTTEPFEHTPLQNAPWREGQKKGIKGKSSPSAEGSSSSEDWQGRFVQVGSFGRYENAQSIAQRLKKIGKAKIIKSSIGARTMYRVRFGPYATAERADKVVRALQKMKVDQAQIIQD